LPVVMVRANQRLDGIEARERRMARFPHISSGF
jgi:hypothetical protein